MFIEKVIESKARNITVYPVHSNRASDLGNPCLRYHVLNRTRWTEKQPIDVGLQMVFDMGNEIERIVLKELAEAGITVIDQQHPFEWKQYQITGHVDGLILDLDDSSKAYPMDIKSSSPYVFDSINTVKDLTQGKYPYLRKYPTQLNLYLLMSNIERGLFIFKNKVSGAYKEIWMDLDYDLGEETLKRAEAINQHVAAGTLPDEIACGDERCPYSHICLPDRIGKDVELLDNDELAEMIDRLNQLKEASAEYNDINRRINKMVEGRDKTICGNYFISGKWIEKKSYTVNASRYWSKKIMPIETH